MGAGRIGRQGQDRAVRLLSRETAPGCEGTTCATGSPNSSPSVNPACSRHYVGARARPNAVDNARGGMRRHGGRCPRWRAAPWQPARPPLRSWRPRRCTARSGDTATSGCSRLNLWPRRWRDDRVNGDDRSRLEVRIRTDMPSPGRASGRGRRAGPCYRLQSSLSGTARTCPPCCDRMSSPL